MGRATAPLACIFDIILILFYVGGLMRGEHMRAVLLVVISLVVAGCAMQQSCGTEVNNVCGDDGVTYQNPCLATQAGAKIAYSGMCQSNATKPETLCSDSDGGRNLLEKGTAQMHDEPAVSDFCIGNASVQENYCESGELKIETAACPGNTVCEEGACTSDLCSDTDGGSNVYSKGTASKGGQSYTDACNGTGYVLEYYCAAGNQVQSYSGECAASEACSDGACVHEETCSDSDAENGIYEKGTVTTGSGTYADYCTDISTLKEYSCSGNTMQAADVFCGSDFECGMGACEPLVCQDSDGGRIKGEYGTATRGAVSYNDTCSGNASVREYYCEIGNIASADMDCGSEETCISGRCAQAGCFDSDMGNVAVTTGTVTIGSLSKNDECANLTILKEYYCDDGDYASASVDCYSYYGGSVRAVCWTGRCAQAYCIDSDGGRNENETGSASMTTATGYASDVSDYCLNNRTVSENYCDSNWLVTEKVSCNDEQYCHMSKCVDAPCSDTDGGLNYIAAGTITKGLRMEQDTCKTSSVLREWQCDGNTVEYEDHTCPAGCDAAGRRCVPL